MHSIKSSLEGWAQELLRNQKDPLVQDWLSIKIDRYELQLKQFDVDFDEIKRAKDLYGAHGSILIKNMRQSIQFINRFDKEKKLAQEIITWLPTIKKGHSDLKKLYDETISSCNTLRENYKKITRKLKVDDIINISKSKLDSEKNIKLFNEGIRIYTAINKYNDISDRAKNIKEKIISLENIVKNEISEGNISHIMSDIILGYVSIIKKMIIKIEEFIISSTEKHNKAITIALSLENTVQANTPNSLLETLEKIEDLTTSIEENIIGLTKLTFYTDKIILVSRLLENIENISLVIKEKIINNIKNMLTDNGQFNVLNIIDRIADAYLTGFFGIFLSIVSLFAPLTKYILSGKEDIKKVVLYLMQLSEANINKTALHNQSNRLCLNPDKLIALTSSNIKSYKTDVIRYIGEFEIAVPADDPDHISTWRLGELISHLDQEINDLFSR